MRNTTPSTVHLTITTHCFLSNHHSICLYDADSGHGDLMFPLLKQMGKVDGLEKESFFYAVRL